MLISIVYFSGYVYARRPNTYCGRSGAYVSNFMGLGVHWFPAASRAFLGMVGNCGSKARPY